MCYLAQVNIGSNLGINIAYFLGLLQIIFGLFYLILVVVQLVRIGNRVSRFATIFYIIQLVIIPIFLLLSGFILIFQGWRLDPILQFQPLILFALIFYLSIKDIMLNTVNRNR
ncbi:Ycf66 family protein [Calothrix sp. CCY 0018]|uniref:Ycf66 family protein n=1 Tax=Calothrix sp. CCY 0018 TaxID=3103864 RepID=UPI0039C623FE